MGEYENVDKATPSHPDHTSIANTVSDVRFKERRTINHFIPWFEMIFPKLILLILLGLSSAAWSEEDSNPTALLEEQTQRRRQEELTRVRRQQEADRLQFEQRLRLFDQRFNAAGPKLNNHTLPSRTGQSLNATLDRIQEKATRRQSQIEQNLYHLELGARNADARQRQELNRLRHRQRSDAFLERQKIRRRRNSISKPAGR